MIAVAEGFLARKGAARSAAWTLGLEGGRNWTLLDCVTSAKLGSRRTAATTPTTHTMTISQRNRTSNLAMAPNT